MESIEMGRIHRNKSLSQTSSEEFPFSNLRIFKVNHSYKAQKDDELDLSCGDLIKHIDSRRNSENWKKGVLNGKSGFFPVNHTQEIERENVLLEYKADEIQEGDFISRGGSASVCKAHLLPSKTESDEVSEKFQVFDSKLSNGVTATIGITLKVSRKQDVALKKLNKADDLRELRKQARLMNGLRHDNIVKCFGYCSDSELFGLLLELCDCSLKKLYKSDRFQEAIPLRIFNDFGVQIANGMEYLINQKVLHRDLKAANVLVKQEDCCLCDLELEKDKKCGKCGMNRFQLIITDFGQTVRIETRSRELPIAGTLGWLAPEVWVREGVKEHYTEYSDVWAFGVVLYELLTRKSPRVKDEDREYLHSKGQFLKIDKNCPEGWKKMMRKCWRTTAQSRPKFEEIVEDFKKYADDRKNESVLVPVLKHKHNKHKKIQLKKEEIKNPNTDDKYTVWVLKKYGTLRFFEMHNERLVFSAVDQNEWKCDLITKVELRNGEDIRKLYEEVALIDSIKHPFIASLSSVFHPEDHDSLKTVYLVQESSITLEETREKIKESHRSLSKFLYQILCGVKYLHDCGVVHKNLNSTKIISERSHQIQLLKTLDSFHYYSPEDLDSEVRDPKMPADIWSIGCIFGGIYTNSVLFPAETRADQRRTIQDVLGSLETTLSCLHYEDCDPNMTGANAIALLKRMLRIDPNERITAEDALNHPYVNDWWKDEKMKVPVINVQRDSDDKTDDEVEELLFWKLEDFED